ncbi:NAD-dependent deacylase [Intrasporangium calvum]|uniref:NAD-dependent protein deacylase n=1 Tax=Intrasporangium calvum TaxID=53358 RepID=A0ABT5GIQ4_9MICO|nr:NAD-dependent deacylase [Intrasporangium calvum]MDC5697561.1 NAD-dependent deacylase [Intrasporangium calvum]
MTVPEPVLTAARAARHVLVLTGAGMSAESGVPTFRDAQSGLWAQYSPEELATPQAWRRDRAFVLAWYLWRFGLVATVEPHAGHVALARWADRNGQHVTVVTQNVDDLHERAGSTAVVHLHGALSGWRCEACARPYRGALPNVPEGGDRVDPPRCPTCGAAIRPGVVWFGEPLPADAWQEAVDRTEAADLVLVVGTSGIVHPAAGLPSVARSAGAVVVEVNPVETEISHVAHHTWRETAAVALPALVDAVSGHGPAA